MSAAQFRYTIRASGMHSIFDVLDSATRAAERARSLAVEYAYPMEVVRGDATGDKTRVCQAHPDGYIERFVPAGSA